ncbi:MAG: hypothetical protein FGM57_01495 [Candidatus Taylorbacteria bacterium]|nr:hypothetical protein [Candidatus Taylorbacteria bacterium]
MDFEDIAWALERKIKKVFIHRSSNKRPSSYPFISGDTFRSIANHIYERPSRMLVPEHVHEKDIVFVESHLLEDFFKEIHPKISHPYILITHNGDLNITEEHTQYVNDKIIHWFAQNVLIDHPKITPIPIGLENAHHANAGMLRLYQEFSSDLAAIKEGKIDDIRETRKSRILYTFNAATNPKERSEALKALKESDTADKLNRGIFISQPAYIRVLRSYTFVASPPGGGEDCHRTWEALYIGTIPIVKDSVMARKFYELGVPLYIVKDWSEVCNLSKYELIAKYDILWKHSNTDTLYFDFWKNLILSHKQ